MVGGTNMLGAANLCIGILLYGPAGFLLGGGPPYPGLEKANGLFYYGALPLLLYVLTALPALS